MRFPKSVYIHLHIRREKMKRGKFVILCLVALVAAGSFLPAAKTRTIALSTSVSPYPTIHPIITLAPTRIPTSTATIQFNVWFVEEVTIRDRGYDATTKALKTVVIRPGPEASGSLGLLYPGTKVMIDMRMIIPIYNSNGAFIREDVWGKVSAQEWYIPIFYIGICYADPCH